MRAFVERSPRILNPETVAAAEQRLLRVLGRLRPVMPKEPVRA
jgi:hypothetical protein